MLYTSDLISYNLSFPSIQWRFYLLSKVVRAAWNNIFIVTLAVISSQVSGRGPVATVRACEEEEDIVKGMDVVFGEY